LQVEHAFPFSDAGQCHAHPPRTVIGVKAHAAITLELAAGGRWIDAHARQIRFAQPAGRIGLDRCQQFLNHRRRLAARLERPAAQTGTVPGV